jgi:hypothetical protein
MVLRQPADTDDRNMPARDFGDNNECHVLLKNWKIIKRRFDTRVRDETLAILLAAESKRRSPITVTFLV